MGSQNNPSKGKNDHCYHCGLKGHWKMNAGHLSILSDFIKIPSEGKETKVVPPFNARVESHLTRKDDARVGPS